MANIDVCFSANSLLFQQESYRIYVPCVDRESTPVVANILEPGEL